MRSVRKITGIMRKVEPLPIPVVRKSTRKQTKKPAKLPPEPPEGRNQSTPATASAITRKFQNVTTAPPSRSASQPPNGRTAAPIRGPTHAYCSALTAANWDLMSSGKPAA